MRLMAVVVWGFQEPEKGKEGKEGENKSGNGGGRLKVSADGTYATETAFTSTTNAKLDAIKAASKPPLRSECGTFFSLERQC